MNDSAFPDEWHRVGRVSFGDVKRRLANATLAERNAILTFICSHPNRIRPAMDEEWLYDVMSHYLLDCITQPIDSDANDDSIHTRYEAAHALVHWFNWIMARDNNPASMRRRADHIAATFTNGGQDVSNCIETGFLEHVLEIPRNRPLFEYWKDDETLSESYIAALQWGEAHTKPDAP